MTDEQQFEETAEKLDADDNDDVEAHKRRIADELKDTDKKDDGDEGDDVEAHRRHA